METKYRESLKPDWYTHPTKRHAIVFSFLFFVGFFLVSAAATDGFREDPFHTGNLLFFFMVLYSGSKVYSIWRNYFKLKRPEAV
jgi:hypothetical protein